METHHFPLDPWIAQAFGARLGRSDTAGGTTAQEGENCDREDWHGKLTRMRKKNWEDDPSLIWRVTVRFLVDMIHHDTSTIEQCSKPLLVDD